MEYHETIQRPIRSGIMGKRAPLRYSLVGDTVNTVWRSICRGTALVPQKSVGNRFSLGKSGS